MFMISLSLFHLTNILTFFLSLSCHQRYACALSSTTQGIITPSHLSVSALKSTSITLSCYCLYATSPF